MDLWIRSQDGIILTKVNSLSINGYISWAVKGWIEGELTDLGIYKSKERALEVLTEIHYSLLLNDNYTHTRFRANRNNNSDDIPTVIVYEMPKK